VASDVSKDCNTFILPLLRSLPLLPLPVYNPLWPLHASIDHTHIYITHHLSYAAIHLGLPSPESKGNTLLQNNEEHSHKNPVPHPRIHEFSATSNLTFAIIILAIKCISKNKDN